MLAHPLKDFGTEGDTLSVDECRTKSSENVVSALLTRATKGTQYSVHNKSTSAACIAIWIFRYMHAPFSLYVSAAVDASINESTISQP